jgi:hypothetical protein
MVATYAIFSVIKNNDRDTNDLNTKNDTIKSISNVDVHPETNFENHSDVIPKKHVARYGVIIGFTTVIVILVIAKMIGGFWSKNYTDCECEKIYNDYVIQMSGYGDGREVNRSGVKDCGKRLLEEMHYDFDVESLSPDYASQYFYEKCHYGVYEKKGARAR